MSLSTVVNYARLTWLIKKKLFIAAMQYRASFVVQVVGMIFNNSIWLILWALFFHNFPSVNGWGFEQMLVLYAFSTFVFALCEIPCDGMVEFSRHVVSGELDCYLMIPKNVVWQVAISKTDISAIGDGIFGLVLMFYVYGFAPLSIAWFMLVSMLSTMLLFDFLVIIQASSFWLGDIEDAAKRMMHMVIGFMLYPQSIFTGALKLLMMTVVPAFFIVTVPATLLVEFSWHLCALLAVSVVFGTAAAISIFNKGLARYESGSAIGTGRS